MKNVFKEFGLQEEMDEINRHYNVDTSLDLNNPEDLKNMIKSSIDEYLNRKSMLSCKILKAGLNFTLLFVELMSKCGIKEFAQVLNHKEDVFKTLKGFTDTASEIQALSKINENCTTLLEKKHAINMCLKLFQDLTSYISDHLTFIMKLMNIKEVIYSKKDYNANLVNKIDRLTGKNTHLDELLNLTNRRLRNKISHGDIYYDFKECVFKTKFQNIICDYETFHNSVFDSFAFENGFILSHQMLALIYLNETEILEKYVQRIEEIC